MGIVENEFGQGYQVTGRSGTHEMRGLNLVFVDGDEAARIMVPRVDDFRKRFQGALSDGYDGFVPLTELDLMTSDPSRGIGKLPNRPMIVIRRDGQVLAFDYDKHGRQPFEAVINDPIPPTTRESREDSRGISVLLSTSLYYARLAAVPISSDNGPEPQTLKIIRRPEERLYRFDQQSVQHTRVNWGVEVKVEKPPKKKPLSEREQLEEYLRRETKRIRIAGRQS